MSEHFKHSFAYLRHTATLSAGAIALQIGFVEKLFPYPKYKALIAVSIIAFTVSIVGSLWTQWGLLAFMARRERLQIDQRADLATGGYVIVMWAGFVVGLVSAVLFALINLFWR